METMETMETMDFMCGGVEIHGIHVRRSGRDLEEPVPSVQTARTLRSGELSRADFRQQPLEPAQFAGHARPQREFRQFRPARAFRTILNERPEIL